MAGRNDGRDHAGHDGRAGGLLRQADALLTDSAWEHEPGERFRTAYLAALRGAGAMIALSGADRAPRARSRSAWVLLRRATPEFAMWADYFEAHSQLRADLEAGLDRKITASRADEFCSRVGAFLYDIDDALVAAARTRPQPSRDRDMTA
ncbi:SAV_6107 family HEPN domain-containing protein [Nocardia rhizosphaerae]|uniref:SAV_6107 family HEPN domain-containing protein n=1 Tax=Nocardia rhizosphaerae TaxID=1691571 RepID=A0ABV8KYG4_9NOCA